MPISTPAVDLAAASRRGDGMRTGLLVTLALLLLALGGWIGLRQQARLDQAQRGVMHAAQTQLQAERLRSSVRAAGRAVLDQLAGGPQTDSRGLALSRSELDQTLARMRQLMDERPEHQAPLDALALLIEQHLDRLQALAGADVLPQAQRQSMLDARRQHAALLEQAIDQVGGHEARLLSAELQSLHQGLDQTWQQAGAVAGTGLAALLLASLMALRLARQRRQSELRLQQTTQELLAANHELEQRVASRTERLRRSAAAQQLRSDAVQALLSALDDGDDLPALHAWRQRQLDSGLVREMLLRLKGHDDIGSLSDGSLHEPGLLGCQELPLGLGQVLYLRQGPPADPQIAALHREELSKDLATWLELRRQRRQREQAERQRDRMQAQLSALFEQSPVGMALLDPSLTILRMNRAMALLDGVEPAQLIGQRFDEALADEPGQRRLAVLPALRQVQAGGAAVLQRSLQMPLAPHDELQGRALLSVLPLREAGAAADAPIFGIAMIGQDITEQDRARQHLAGLTQQLMQVSEAERRSLARELHDDLGQRLAALKMNLQLLRPTTGRSADKAHTATSTMDPALADAASALLAPARLLDGSVAIVDACIAQVRSRAASLRPPQLDALGLVAALRGHAQEQAALSGVTIRVQARVPEAALRDEWCSQVFRIVQEALRNALSHGQPSEVLISLQAGHDSLRLRVRDDGLGFDADALAARPPGRQGMGLLNLRERTELTGGEFHIGPAAGTGTELLCDWPLQAALNDEANRDPRCTS